MSGRTMDRAAAERFVAAWCASWCRVDIDAVVAHFADDAQMRSPLALSLTGSPVVTGADALLFDGAGGRRAGMEYVQRQRSHIGGGTTEMARNIISERILGMPRERTPDKDVPYSDVPRGSK